MRRGAPARTSKPKYRIEAAEALIADEPPPRDTWRDVLRARRLGKTVYDVEDSTTRSPPTTAAHAVRGSDLAVGPGDRIGIVGVNGAGKTSLLKLLAGETTRRGQVSRSDRAPATCRSTSRAAAEGPRARGGAGGRPGARIGNQEISASSLAERFGFAANRQWTPVGDLSGGERRRLQLLRLLMAEPNVLLLDEPTNDLDIDTLTALEDLLDSFPGTVLVVSHDRYFVDRVCDTVVALFGDGSLAELPGGVEEYLAAGRRWCAVDPAAGGGRAGRCSVQRVPTVGRRRPRRKEAARLERRMLKLDADEKKLHEQLAAAATDYAKAAELDAELKARPRREGSRSRTTGFASELAEG